MIALSMSCHLNCFFPVNNNKFTGACIIKTMFMKTFMYHFREIKTSLTITKELMPDVTPDGDVTCSMVFLETIPSGAYVDPYQLKSLKPFGGPDVRILMGV